MPCAKCFGEINDIAHLSTGNAIYELCQDCTDTITDWIEDEATKHELEL